jgi:hypothetical protein
MDHYRYDRNILAFVEEINCLLETQAKKTIWFHIIPLLEEDDQEYCKRKLFLNTINLSNSRSNSPVLSTSISYIIKLLIFFVFD